MTSQCAKLLDRLHDLESNLSDWWNADVLTKKHCPFLIHAAGVNQCYTVLQTMELLRSAYYGIVPCSPYLHKAEKRKRKKGKIMQAVKTTPHIN
jgi:hypothetical protein